MPSVFPSRRFSLLTRTFAGVLLIFTVAVRLKELARSAGFFEGLLPNLEAVGLTGVMILALPPSIYYLRLSLFHPPAVSAGADGLSLGCAPFGTVNVAWRDIEAVRQYATPVSQGVAVLLKPAALMRMHFRERLLVLLHIVGNEHELRIPGWLLTSPAETVATRLESLRDAPGHRPPHPPQGRSVP